MAQPMCLVYYCTNAAQAQRTQPTMQVLPVPDCYNIGADYGITVLKAAPASAHVFVDFVLGSTGRAILATYGFILP